MQPASQNEVTLISDILTRATKAAANEHAIVNANTALRKRLGLAQYCLARHAELGRQIVAAAAPVHELRDSVQVYERLVGQLEHSAEWRLVHGEE